MTKYQNVLNLPILGKIDILFVLISRPTENKAIISQAGDNQNTKENNGKVAKNPAKINEDIGGAVKKKTKKQIIPNSGKIEKTQENKKLVVDLDLLDPKLFSNLQGIRYQNVFFKSQIQQQSCA